MSRAKRLLTLFVLAAAAVPLSAAPTPIKLGTLVPSNSIWHSALLDMGNTWRKDTAARVALTLFPDGRLGDEATMIKNMRQDVLQASFMTAVGLSEIDEAFNVFGMPFFLHTPEEEAAVEHKLQPVSQQ